MSKHLSQIQRDEHARIGGVDGKKVFVVDDSGKPASIDDSTETLQTITYNHHEIHEGDHYNYCDYQLDNGNGDTIEFIMETPATDEVHLTFSVSGSGSAVMELYEGASGISGGSSITPRNNNRNSGNSSGTTITKDPSSITDDGTRAAGYLIGAKKNSGIAKRSKEYVLSTSQTYLVRITSKEAGIDISWGAEWYEHSP